MSLEETIIVAVPVKNEAARISACLDALLTQTVPADEIVLLLNNCTDETSRICNGMRAGVGKIRIVEREIAGAVASAGEARRLAMDFAAGLSEDGILLTTDADGVVPPHWIDRNLHAFAKGAEAVCGMAEIDPVEALQITPAMHRDHVEECACLDLLDEIDAMLAPDLCDPWPRHQQRSGASIAVRAPVFRTVGGIPAVPVGEDRAFIDRLRLFDVKIRHAPEIVVTVSGRLEGRAAGGMADTMKRRLQKRDDWTDARLEPATDAYRRSLAKAALRAVWQEQEEAVLLAEDLLIHPASLALTLRGPYFGAAWAEVQRLSPVLQRRRVRYDDLPRETRQARRLRDDLLLNGTGQPVRLMMGDS